jgi:serine-type D-Ala-D-Ala carboxypeptidase (penicillin-binding protein 5/6)
MRNTRLRRSRARRRYPFGAIILILLVVYVAAMLFWPVQAIQATVTAEAQAQPQTVPQLSWPAYGQSALGTNDAEIIGTSGTQTSVPMASITKVVTALTVLEDKPIAAGQTGPTITLTAEDAARYNQYYAVDGTVAKAEAGMQLTEYQILQGMLISSANNYADTLAVWAYGSVENYLAAAKSYLHEQHLANTVVADASGFSAESKSTASDLVALGRLAMSKTVITDIVSQKTAVIPGVGTLQNTNLLLGVDGVVGIKTGTTDEAGSCLLFAAKYTIGDTPVTIIGATLGGPSHAVLARDVTALLASAKAGFQEVNLAALNQRFAVYKAPWEAEAKAITNKNTKLVTWPGTPINQKVTVSPLKPNTNPNTVGTVTFTVGSQKQNAQLVLNKPLEKPGLFWRLTHPKQVIEG